MSSRIKELQIRIANMKAFKADEMKLAEPSASYISDLNETIKSCMTQINHLKKNGDSIEVMNGGGEFA